MKNLKYIVGMFSKSTGVFTKRMFGKKHSPNWDLKTELIWASTRFTLLSSNKFGLEWLKKLSNQFTPKPKLAKQIDIETIQNNVGKCLKINSKTTRSESNKIIIYFHGGGYVIGSPQAGIEFTSRLSIHSDATIFVPFYPTAPEETYPSAHKFAKEIIKTLITEHPDNEIYLAGDSAGAALVLSTYRNLSKNQTAKITGCILISPWIEPTSEKGSIKTNSENDIGNRDYLLNCYNTYLNKAKVQQEYPLNFDENNLVKLPKTLITIGTFEMLFDQAKRLNENLKLLDTEVMFLEYDSMFHTFWNLAPAIKEADEMIQDISEWMD